MVVARIRFCSIMRRSYPHPKWGVTTDSVGSPSVQRGTRRAGGRTGPRSPAPPRMDRRVPGRERSPHVPEGAVMPARTSPGPSVKDPGLYEELRDQGASKEKAARISNAAANTSRSAVGRKGGRSGDYEDWTKADLMKRAREIGIDGRSSMSKSQLIDALRHH